jgi:hypothetical protein
MLLIFKNISYYEQSKENVQMFGARGSLKRAELGTESLILHNNKFRRAINYCHNMPEENN